MKSSLLSIFIIPLIIFLYKTDKSDQVENTVVLELFTSQGCSSCPPADLILNEVKNNSRIALSYHVDYWNYIGWKDPFSKAKYTERQKRYASKFNNSTIYTPQLVINGKEQVPGSRKQLVKQKIQEHARQLNENTVEISDIERDEHQVKFRYSVTGDMSTKGLRTVLVIDERKTSVSQGENRNKTLVNTNIVVSETQIQPKQKEGFGSIIIPELISKLDKLSLIIIIEDDQLEITGASQILL